MQFCVANKSARKMAHKLIEAITDLINIIMPMEFGTVWVAPVSPKPG